MNKKIKKSLYFSLILIFAFSLLSIDSPDRYNYNFDSLLSFGDFASADDDEDDEDEDKDENEERPTVVNESIPVEKTKPQTYTQTIKLPDQIITSTVMENVYLLDTDKDGIADSDDPHPTIPEFIIVQDSDRDGIADIYDIDVVSDLNGNGIDDKLE